MENRNQTSERAEVIETKQSPIHTTTLSKYLAMGLFVALPFLGGWIGYTHAPEKIIETERIVIQEVEKRGIIFKMRHSHPMNLLLWKRLN